MSYLGGERCARDFAWCVFYTLLDAAGRRRRRHDDERQEQHSAGFPASGLDDHDDAEQQADGRHEDGPATAAEFEQQLLQPIEEEKRKPREYLRDELQLRGPCRGLWWLSLANPQQALLQGRTWVCVPSFI